MLATLSTEALLRKSRWAHTNVKFHLFFLFHAKCNQIYYSKDELGNSTITGCNLVLGLFFAFSIFPHLGVLFTLYYETHIIEAGIMLWWKKLA